MYNTMDGIKIRPSILFSATTVTMKFTQSWEHPLQRSDYFYTVSFITNTLFHLCVTCCVSITINLCWSTGALHVHCISVWCSPQNGILRLHPSGGQKDGSQKYYIKTLGRMRKKSPLHCCNCIPCMQTGVQSGVMLKEDLIHLSVFAKHFKFVVSTSLMSANIALYW